MGAGASLIDRFNRGGAEDLCCCGCFALLNRVGLGPRWIPPNGRLVPLIILEPVARNTGPAVLIAALLTARTDPNKQLLLVHG